jgi:hypothetical protein
LLAETPGAPIPTAQIIVCEQSSRWAVALRWALAGAVAAGEEPIRLIATRSLSACWQQLRESPASLVAIEVPSGGRQELARRIAALPRSFPWARFIGLGRATEGPCGWRLRQLGAIHLVSSTRSVDSIVRVLHRHRHALPTAPTGLRRTIWQRMPWAEPAEPPGSEAMS